MLTKHAQIYRAKRPRPPVSDEAREVCRRFNNPKPRRLILSGDGAHVAATLFRACGHDVEVE